MVKSKRIIRLERDEPDHILPKDFYEVLIQRFIPILSLTYISSLIGIASQNGDFLHYIFHNRAGYIISLYVVLWVSIPGLLWICMRGNALLNYYADLWYRIVAVIMVITVSMSAALFPEADMFGMRIYFVLTVPIILIMYFFLVRGGLPKAAAYPLNVLGILTLLNGVLIGILYNH